MSTEQEILFTQLETYRQETLAIVENVSEEEAENIPKGFNNNIRWNLGHIYLDQYLWIEAVTRERTIVDPNLNSWFGFGTSPNDFTENTPTLAELKKLLAAQTLEIKESYGHCMTEVFPPTEMGMRTIQQVLIRTIYHEGLHTATILYLKRFIQ